MLTFKPRSIDVFEERNCGTIESAWLTDELRICSYLLMLAVMEYLLSIGLNFDFSLTVLELLMAKGLFLSAKSWGKDQTRLMFVLGLDNQEVQLEIFNVELAKQK